MRLWVLLLACVFLRFGGARADEGGSVYDDLYQVLAKNVSASEKYGCASRIPFGEGYDCGPNKPGFEFQKGSLHIDSVNLTNWDSVVINAFEFSDRNCINYAGFERHFLKSAPKGAVKLLRSYAWSATDGGGLGNAEEFRFRRAKVSIQHRYDTDTSCITSITVRKRVR